MAKTIKHDDPSALPVVLVTGGSGTVHGVIQCISGRCLVVKSMHSVAVGELCALISLLPGSAATGQSRYLEASGRVRRAVRSGKSQLVDVDLFDVKGDFAQWSSLISSSLAKVGAKHASIHAV